MRRSWPGWSRSAGEARRWCSVAEHPFPADRVADVDRADVQPWLLVADPTARRSATASCGWTRRGRGRAGPAGRPARRRSGLGRALVAALVEAAAATGLAGCLLRVVPDNVAAIALYRAAGFAEVDPARTAEWNDGQPTEYVWFEWPVRT